MCVCVCVHEHVSVYVWDMCVHICKYMYVHLYSNRNETTYNTYTVIMKILGACVFLFGKKINSFNIAK